jgi:hypothetical protein
MHALIFLLFFLTFSVNGVRRDAVHSETGPCIDPNGRCDRGFAGDSGGGMDPNGAPRTTAAGDHRCTIDPNGNCAGGFAGTAGTDDGVGIDPHGG